jgi:hypothetical protein
MWYYDGCQLDAKKEEADIAIQKAQIYQYQLNI